jgi:hypothetical protein
MGCVLNKAAAAPFYTPSDSLSPNYLTVNSIWGHSNYSPRSANPPPPHTKKFRKGVQQSCCTSVATVKASQLRTSNINPVTHKTALCTTISTNTAPFPRNIQRWTHKHRKTRKSKLYNTISWTTVQPKNCMDFRLHHKHYASTRPRYLY